MFENPRTKNGAAFIFPLPIPLAALKFKANLEIKVAAAALRAIRKGGEAACIIYVFLI